MLRGGLINGAGIFSNYSFASLYLLSSGPQRFVSVWGPSKTDVTVFLVFYKYGNCTNDHRVLRQMQCTLGAYCTAPGGSSVSFGPSGRLATAWGVNVVLGAGLSTAQIVGVVLGVVAFVILLVIIVFVMVELRLCASLSLSLSLSL